MKSLVIRSRNLPTAYPPFPVIPTPFDSRYLSPVVRFKCVARRVSTPVISCRLAGARLFEAETT